MGQKVWSCSCWLGAPTPVLGAGRLLRALTACCASPCCWVWESRQGRYGAIPEQLLEQAIQCWLKLVLTNRRRNPCECLVLCAALAVVGQLPSSQGRKSVSRGWMSLFVCQIQLCCVLNVFTCWWAMKVTLFVQGDSCVGSDSVLFAHVCASNLL